MPKSAPTPSFDPNDVRISVEQIRADLKELRTEYHTERRWLFRTATAFVIVIGYGASLFWNATNEEIGNKIQDTLKGSAVARIVQQISQDSANVHSTLQSILTKKKLIDSTYGVIQSSYKKAFVFQTTSPESWEPWKQGATNGIKVDVTFPKAEFHKVPMIFLSLDGTNSHWALTGTSSLYNVTKDGFSVFIRWADGKELTPDIAKSLRWRVNWIAFRNE